MAKEHREQAVIDYERRYKAAMARVKAAGHNPRDLIDDHEYIERLIRERLQHAYEYRNWDLVFDVLFMSFELERARKRS